MPSTYTVVEATKGADKPDRGFGPMQTIMLKLKNEQGQERAGISWYTKASTPLPAAGSQLFGVARDGQYGWEFKKAQQGGVNGRSGPARDFKADPAKQAAIAAESAQKTGIEVIRFAHEAGRNPLEVAESLKQVAESLYEQIQAAAQEAQK